MSFFKVKLYLIALAVFAAVPMTFAQQGSGTTITSENAADVVMLTQIGRGTITDLEWSPDGSRLAVSGSLGVWLYDAADLTTEPVLLPSKPVAEAAFSGDGSQLAAAAGRTVIVWDVMTGEEVIRNTDAHGSTIETIDFSPTDMLIASGDEGGKVILIDPSSGEVLALLEDHTDDVEDVVFSPDGAVFATGSRDQTVRLWNARDFSSAAVLEGHESPVGGLAFSPDGSILYSGDDRLVIRQWEVSSGQEVGLIEPENSNYIVSLGLSPDGGTLFVGEMNNSGVRAWNLGSGEELGVMRPHTWRTADAALKPDGTVLALAGDESVLYMLDPAAQEVISTVPGHSNDAQSVAFSPDGSLISVSHNYQELRVYDAATTALVHEEAVAFRIGFTANETHNLFSPDGSKLATTDSFQVVVFDTASWEQLYTTDSGAGTVLFSLDGSLLITTEDNEVALFEAATGEELNRLSGHNLNVTTVAFSPDGSILASSSEDGTVRLWGVP